MINIIRIFLSVVLLLPLGVKTGVVINWAVQQDYIAANLCENRNKPELHCNGKCVLMQKMGLANDVTDEPAPLPEITRLEISSFLLNEDFQLYSFRFFDSDNFTVSEKETALSRLLIYDIFHPPRLLV